MQNQNRPFHAANVSQTARQFHRIAGREIVPWVEVSLKDDADHRAEFALFFGGLGFDLCEKRFVWTN
jgi:hypothetical protein